MRATAHKKNDSPLEEGRKQTEMEATRQCARLYSSVALNGLMRRLSRTFRLDASNRLIESQLLRRMSSVTHYPGRLVVFSCLCNQIAKLDEKNISSLNLAEKRFLLYLAKKCFVYVMPRCSVTLQNRSTMYMWCRDLILWRRGVNLRCIGRRDCHHRCLISRIWQLAFRFF